MLIIAVPEKRYRPFPARIEAVVQVLDSVMGRNQYADKALERYFKNNRKAGSDDRAFISEMVYDAVRHWNYLVWFTGDKFSFKREGLWLLVGNLLFLKGYELPEWSEFSSINRAQAAERAKRKNLPRHIMQSVSEELDLLAGEQMGEERWTTELTAMNVPAEVVIRANTLRNEPQQLRMSLAKIGVDTDILPEYSDALKLGERTNVFRHPHFEQGLFEMQDAGSQTIAPFLEVEPGMRVIDACAGAGGKTLHLACLMKNKGKIIAMDVELFKLEELKNRARRNGISIIEARLIEGTKTIKGLHESADRLLLDVPCTGSGVLRRNPDAKFKITRDFFNRVTALQGEILDNYSRMLKPGGKMVYATCSLFADENQNRVNLFLERNADFILERDYMHYPSETGFDGFYMALIRRN
jgi:16S rRNA (cytosine967-C5)-methyltransferase